MDMVNTFVTESYKLTPTIYLRVALHKLLPTLAVIICIPVIACLIGSYWDSRMLFVALIFIFLVAPMVLAHIYFSRMLTTEAQRSLSAKHVEVSPGQYIKVIYEGTGESPVPSPITIDWDEIESCRMFNREIAIYTLKHSQPLIIPMSTLPTHIDPMIFCTSLGN